MNIKIKKLHPDAITPTYQTPGSACFDLHAIEGWILSPHTPGIFNTGLAFEIPPGYVMNIYSRSGHGFKDDVRLANCVGKIDSDYRGEVLVKLAIDAPYGYFKVFPGDRIAQAEVVKIDRCVFEEVDELSSTERGDNGFGSTGR